MMMRISGIGVRATHTTNRYEISIYNGCGYEKHLQNLTPTMFQSGASFERPCAEKRGLTTQSRIQLSI